MRLFGRELSLTAQSMLLVKQPGVDGGSSLAGGEQTSSIVNVLMTSPVAASLKGSSSKTYMKVLLIGGTAFLFAYAGYKLWRGLGHTKIDPDGTPSTETIDGDCPEGEELELDLHQGFSLHPRREGSAVCTHVKIDGSCDIEAGLSAEFHCTRNRVGTQMIENRSKPLSNENVEKDKDRIEGDFKIEGETDSRWHDTTDCVLDEIQFDPDFSVPPGVLWSDLCEDVVAITENNPQTNNHVASSTIIDVPGQNSEVHIAHYSSINLSRIPTIVISPPLSELIDNDSLGNNTASMASMSYVNDMDEFDLMEDPDYNIPAGVSWVDVCPDVSNSDVRVSNNNKTSSLSTLASTSDESSGLQPDPTFSIPAGALWADVCEQAETQGGAGGLPAGASGETPWCEDDGAGDGFNELPFVQSDDDTASVNGYVDTESDVQAQLPTIQSDDDTASTNGYVDTESDVQAQLPTIQSDDDTSSANGYVDTESDVQPQLLSIKSQDDGEQDNCNTYTNADVHNGKDRHARDSSSLGTVEDAELQQDPLFSVPSGVMWADICNDPNQSTIDAPSNGITDDSNVATVPDVSSIIYSASSSEESPDSTPPNGSGQTPRAGTLEATGLVGNGNCNSNNSNNATHGNGDASFESGGEDTTAVGSSYGQVTDASLNHPHSDVDHDDCDDDGDSDDNGDYDVHYNTADECYGYNKYHHHDEDHGFNVDNEEGDNNGVDPSDGEIKDHYTDDSGHSTDPFSGNDDHTHTNAQINDDNISDTKNHDEIKEESISTNKNRPIVTNQEDGFSDANNVNSTSQLRSAFDAEADRVHGTVLTVINLSTLLAGDAPASGYYNVEHGDDDGCDDGGGNDDDGGGCDDGGDDGDSGDAASSADYNTAHGDEGCDGDAGDNGDDGYHDNVVRNNDAYNAGHHTIEDDVCGGYDQNPEVKFNDIFHIRFFMFINDCIYYQGDFGNVLVCCDSADFTKFYFMKRTFIAVVFATRSVNKDITHHHLVLLPFACLINIP